MGLAVSIPSFVAWFVCGSGRDTSSTRSSTAEMLPFGESSTHKRLVVDSSAEAAKKASLKLLATWFSDEKTSRILDFRMVRWQFKAAILQVFFVSSGQFFKGFESK